MLIGESSIIYELAFKPFNRLLHFRWNENSAICWMDEQSSSEHTSKDANLLMYAKNFLVVQPIKCFTVIDMNNKKDHNRIIKECKKFNKDDDFIRDYLEYYDRLTEKSVPVIVSPKHFSMLVGLDHNYVCAMAHSPKNFYRTFYIQKSNHKLRKISEPLPDLKYVQKWILTNILEKIQVSPYAKAYVPKSSVKMNAKFHRKQKVVLSMDIKNFFPSIKIKDIVGIFKSIGYLDDVSCFMAYLCCNKYSLPQGAPTSPYLSNLRLISFDLNIEKYTQEKKIRYTRYADDLTFSGDFDPHKLINYVSKCVWREGFVINSDKTRVAYGNTRQEVTGIVVNEVLQIPKVERKKIRQDVYYVKKYGLDSHLAYLNEDRAHYINHLLGKINFALFINPKDEELREYYEYLMDLLKNTYSDI